MLIQTLSIANLSFSFQKHNEPFLKNICARFNSNKLNFIQGANGTGKSTLLRIISGHINAHEFVEGTLIINESMSIKINNTHGLSFELQEIIGVVPQKYDEIFVSVFTGEENLRFMQIKKYPSLLPLSAVKEIGSFLKSFNIPLDKPLHFLSGGQRQIIGIGMMVQKNKSILILDEPTASLDESNSLIVFNFLEELRKEFNTLIIIVSHDKELIHQYGEKSYFELSGGTLHEKVY